MTNPLQSDGFRNLSLLLARVGLGTYFLLAAYSKFVKGLGQWASEQATRIPSFLPTPAGKAYLLMLGPVELLVGVALVVGFYTRTAATLIFLMLLSFMIAFGIQFQMTKAPFFTPNLIYITLAMLLMASGGGQIAVDASMGGGGGGGTPGPKKK